MSELAIYSGRDLVGYVANTGRGLWHAKGPAGRVLSTHPTRMEAEAAVIAAAKGRAAG